MKKLIGLSVGALLLSGAVMAAGPGGWGGCAEEGAGFGHARMHEPGEGRGANPGRMLGYLSDKLELSEAQRGQIEALLAERPDPRADRRAMHEQMQTLDPASPDYVDRVAALAQEHSQQMATRMVEHAQLRQQIYALLSPDQQQRFGQLHEQRGWMGHGPKH